MIYQRHLQALLLNYSSHPKHNLAGKKRLNQTLFTSTYSFCPIKVIALLMRISNVRFCNLDWFSLQPFGKHSIQTTTRLLIMTNVDKLPIILANAASNVRQRNFIISILIHNFYLKYNLGVHMRKMWEISIKL